MRVGVLVLLAVLGAAGGAAAQSQTTLLHDALHLGPAQENDWRAYQRALADPEAEARATETQRMLPQLPTPRRLALIRAQMEADFQAFERRARAVRAFYDTLNPVQQQTFDRQTAASVPPDR